MSETSPKLTTQDLHRKSMDAKAAAKEARLKAALRSNLRRRKDSTKSDEGEAS